MPERLISELLYGCACAAGVGSCRLLDMQDQPAGTHSGCRQETFEIKLCPQGCVSEIMRKISESDGASLKPDTPRLFCFLDLGLVFDHELQSGNTSGCVPEWLDLNDKCRK